MESIKIPWKGWKIVDMIGKGSYGTVYKIERAVGSYSEKSAMKVIPIPPSQQIIEDAYNDGYDDESVLKICKRFYDDTLTEYKLMESLKGHKNIVSCEDVAALPVEGSIGWKVYIRMELLTPFLKYKSASKFDQNEIIKLGKDICQALILCEKNNIVHRDIKPSNIFIDDQGNYKLGDFGVARTLDHSTNATRVGTERFMAPEVINRKPYDESVDIYSLGLVMYWLLNGRRMPFLSPNRVPTAEEQEKAYYRRITGENLWLPHNGSLSLRKAVLKACSFDRSARYQSALDMLDALNEIESSLDQKTNNVTCHSSSNASDNMSEDETVGNSWDFEDVTVGANFNTQSKNHNSPSYSHNYEDETVGPGWDKAEPKDNNRKTNNKGTADTYGTDTSNSNEDDPFQEFWQYFAEDKREADRNRQLHRNTNPRKTKRKPFKATAKGILKNIFIYLFIVPTVLIIIVTIGQEVYSKISTHHSVTFGGIEWITLEKNGDITLLLSKDIIEKSPYKSDFASTTWETCTLRTYLNATWYEDTFSDEEKAKIQTTNVVNINNAEYNTSGGNTTKDKVFLLSIDEADQYFSRDQNRVAECYGIVDSWWLRSPGNNDRSAAYVGRNGFIYNYGESVSNESIGIRPALWVNLE